MFCKPVYCAGTTPAISYAKTYLSENNIPISEYPQWDTGHLLLDVPSFRPGSALASPNSLDTLLASLPPDTCVWGGNLNHPSLKGRKTYDFLTNETYLAENAAITAHCAIRIGSEKLPCTFRKLPVLIMGWGRIGKCLASILKNMGADVCVVAHTPSQRGALTSLGFQTADASDLPRTISDFRLIYNTVPQMVLPKELTQLTPDSIKIDLASQPGIDSEDTIVARGLPGIYAPESSGRLIGKTFLQFLKEENP